MLSETEIHYLTGYLYVASGENVVSVTLGEKLYDAAADELRDVDIALVVAGQIGVIAAEVKNHSRKLDVIAVEGLCQKLADIPEVAKRAIVSASGFTEPAAKKAAAHDVGCLHLVHGALPSLSTIDISRISGLTVATTEWIDGPHVTIGPAMQLTLEEHREINPRTCVELGDGAVVSFKELGDTIADQFDLAKLQLEIDGDTFIDVTWPFDQPVKIRARPRILEATDARLRGKARRSAKEVPIHTSCYLADQRGEPFASAVVFEVNGHLIGMGVGSGTNTLRIFQIPGDVRTRRPIRRRIFQSTG